MSTKTRQEPSCLLSALCDLRGFQKHERCGDFDKARSGLESNPFLSPVPCPQSPLCNSQVTQMLHLAQSKPQIPRTKRFPIARTRNKSVTSNFILLPTSLFPLAAILSPHLVGQAFQPDKCAFLARNLKPRISTLLPHYVRVFSEYSDIPNTTNPDFPEQNIRFEARERKSTLISKFNFRSAHAFRSNRKSFARCQRSVALQATDTRGLPACYHAQGTSQTFNPSVQRGQRRSFETLRTTAESLRYSM